MVTGKRRTRRHNRTSCRQSTRRQRFTRQLGIGLERLEDRTLLATVTFGPAMTVQAGGVDVQVASYSVPSLADWNSDGVTDLIVGEKTANSEGKVRVYLNSGTNAAPVYGSFAYAQTEADDLAVPGGGCMGVFPRVFDWNGDGLKDLVIGLADGTVQVALNENTDANPILASPIPVQVGQAGAKTNVDVGVRATLDIVDWNNDGRHDLVLGDLDGNVHVLPNEADLGSPDFHNATTVLDAAAGQGVPTGRSSIAVTDLDGDGRKDMVVGNTEGQLLLFANTGTDVAPQFAGYQPIESNGIEIDLPGTPRSRPFVGDFNNDGTIDLLVGAADGLVRVYVGSPSGTQEAAPDLVAFAQALDQADAKLFGAAWCHWCTEQKKLFEDGGQFLPFIEVTNPDRTWNQLATDNNITDLPTWEFPDGSRSEGMLSLETISQRSGVAIPTSSVPSIAPIEDLTVLSGSPLHIPLDGYDPNGDPLTYTVTSSNPLVTPTILQGNRSMRIDVQSWGEMVFELFEQRAPRSTARLVELAGSDFYDGIIFHRVIDGFMIQSGDPTATGSGGSTLGTFDDQFHVDLQHNREGVLSHAKSGDDTSDSQFFATLDATRWLDFNHSISGQLVEGFEVLRAIGRTATGASDRPTVDITMNTADVFQDTENAMVMLDAAPDAVGQSADITVIAADNRGNQTQAIFQVTVLDDVAQNGGANGGPFLADIANFTTGMDTPVEIQLSATDVEGDPVVYEAASMGTVGYTLDVNNQTGLVTVTPPNGFVGRMQVLVGVRALNGSDTGDTYDHQVVAIDVIAGESGFDFGDAPASYPVTLAEDGARHAATGPTLGVNRDVEADGVHSANADADDITGVVASGGSNGLSASAAAGESGAEAENGESPDLVAFAQALEMNGVKLYGAGWCHNCVEQKSLFEDGAQFLPYVDLFNADGTRNEEGPHVTNIPAWDFPDGNGGTTLVVGRLTLEDISAQSGIAIPLSDIPWVKPIDQTLAVLSGSPLHIPLDAYDPNGDPLTYDITVEDANGNPTDLLTAEVLQNNRSMKLNLVSRPSDTPGVAGGTAFNLGEMVFELFEQRAPDPSGRVIQLAESGFYNGSYMHRSDPGFVFQFGGETPTAGGASDLGLFDDQFHVDLQHNRDGVLSYAKGGDDTNDAQFFLTLNPTRPLDFQHSIFGQMVEGYELMDVIQEEPVFAANPNNPTFTSPEYPKEVSAIEIFADTENGVAMLDAHPDAIGQSFTLTVTATDGEHASPPVIVHVVVGDDIPENGGANGGPFLEDIGEVVTAANTPAQIQLSAVDVEGDPVFFDAAVMGNVDYQLDVDNDTGLVTVTPPDDFVGELEVLVGVRAVSPSNTADTWDQQVVTVDVVDAVLSTPSVDLLPSSDSNIPDDNITNIANLLMRVSEAVHGALVEILDGDTVVGQGIANSDVDITTDLLDDGVHTLTARQTLDGVQSERSAELQVTVDTLAPPAFTSTPPTTATVGVAMGYDAENPEEGTSGLYSLVVAPDGVSIHPDTGVLSWTPTQDQAGVHNFQILATDVAGNSTPQDINIQVFVPTVRITLATVVQTGIDGNGDAQYAAVDSIAVGSDYLLQGYLKDIRQPPMPEGGVFSSWVDIHYDSSLVSPNADGPDEIIFTDEYQWLTSADFETQDIIADIGSAASPDGNSATVFPTFGPDNMLQFSIPMTAINEGEVDFTAAPSDNTVDHPISLFANEGALPPEEVVIWGTSLVITESLLARDDIFNVDEDSSDNPLDVINNDENSQGGTITIISVSATSNAGEVIISNGEELNYTPPPDFFGEDEFTYTIGNDQSTSTATVTVQVFPVNDDPAAVDDTFTVGQDSQSNFLNVLGNDIAAPDQGESLRVSAVVNPSQGGTATIVAGGSGLNYTPPSGFVGQETIDYTVSDGNGGTDEATVTVTVEETPSAVDDEDGVFLRPITVGQFDAIVTVNVQNAPGGAKLDAWIDFDGDGSWDGQSEQFADSRDVVQGENAIAFDVPSWANEGTTFARFRVSTAGDLDVGGWAADGEVEDHPVTILAPNMQGVVAARFGSIGTPSEVDEYRFDITDGPSPGVYSFVVAGEPGGFDADTVQIIDAAGLSVDVTAAIPDVNASPEQSVVVASLAPGSYRVLVTGQSGSVGGYRVDMRMPGDVGDYLGQSADNAVSDREVQLAQAAMLQHNYGFNFAAQELFGQKLGIDLSVAQFRAEFDANLNGHIDPLDMDAIITNHGSGAAVPVDASLAPVASCCVDDCCVAEGMGESESAGGVTLGDIGSSAFQNPERPTDVNADKYVTPLDVLLVIDAINSQGSEAFDAAVSGTGEGESEIVVSPPYYDVNGDYSISSLDVLLVIRDLAAGSSNLFDEVSAEGEAVALAAPVTPNEAWPGSFAVDQPRNQQPITGPMLAQAPGVVVSSREAEIGYARDQQLPATVEEPRHAVFSRDESVQDSGIGLDSELLDTLVEEIARSWGP